MPRPARRASRAPGRACRARAFALAGWRATRGRGGLLGRHFFLVRRTSFRVVKREKAVLQHGGGDMHVSRIVVLAVSILAAPPVRPPTRAACRGRRTATGT